MKRRFRVLYLIASAAFLVMLCSFGNFTKFRQSDKEICGHLRQQNLSFELGYYQAIGRQIRYLVVDNKARDNLILIHGAPGSMSRYNKFLDDTLLRKYYNFYIIDRPGYGYSGFGDAEVSIDRNVEAVLPIFNYIRDTSGKNIVVGKSYGGPIASRLAMLHPELVDGLVLVAPAIQPGAEKTYSISYLMVDKHCSHFFPAMYVTASREKLAHKRELEKIACDWDCIHCPVTMVQGLRDNLVYPSNISYIKNHVCDSLLEVVPLKDETHFFSSKAYPEIVKAFIRMKDK